MKTIKILTITILALLFASCTKQPLTPGNYTTVNPPVQNNQTNYINGGNVPTSTVTTNNQAVGTTWVISYMKVGFNVINPVPLDTIRFIDNQNYTINGGTNKPYQLTNGALSSYNLVLNFFYPFGSGNYSGEISTTFVSDGVINFCQFTNINSTTQTVTASFTKI